jgi:carbon storage regulator
MLVLSRKKNERIVIGNDDIRITVISIHGTKVVLGIEAAKDIPVHRMEVFNSMREQKGGKNK